MAYIFKNNKELNNYVCEIENLRIISWINYNYYDDGDVYSISDKDELTLDEILMFTDSSFSLEFIIEQKDIYEDLTVKEEQILHEIRRRIYNAKHLYVNLDDKINREEFGISNGISCQYFSVEDLKFSIDSYRNFDLNELKEKIEKIKSIKFNDEYKNLRKNRICKYLIDILEEKKEKIKEINKYIENLCTKDEEGNLFFQVGEPSNSSALYWAKYPDDTHEYLLREYTTEEKLDYFHSLLDKHEIFGDSWSKKCFHESDRKYILDLIKKIKFLKFSDKYFEDTIIKFYGKYKKEDDNKKNYKYIIIVDNLSEIMRFHKNLMKIGYEIDNDYSLDGENLNEVLGKVNLNILKPKYEDEEYYRVKEIENKFYKIIKKIRR